MLKNEVKFQIQPGGLGRLPAGQDHVSALIWTISSVPAAWGTASGKKYLSLDEAEADGITKEVATTTELWYQIREFFRITGVGELYVIQKTGLTAEKFIEVTEGRVRQAAWQNANTTVTAEVALAQAFAEELDAVFAPLVIITNVKEGVAVYSDLHASDAPRVSVIAFGDGGYDAATMIDDLGVDYIPALGTTLGLIAYASVHENIGWPRKFGFSDKYYFSKLILSDGTNVSAKTDAQLQAIADAGYIFARKLIGLPGYFVYDTFTAVTANDDYSVIEHNRVIDKAKREIRAYLIPDLMSPLYVDAEGKLSADTIAYFKALTSAPVERMQSVGEISGFRVMIDPDQDVLTTSKLVITVKIQPVGVAREIIVNIGFAVNLTQ